jgi:hypothetical protein
VHCPKAKTKKQKRRKHRKHKSPQNHDKSKSRASASPASLPQNIFASLWSSKSYQASRRPAAAPGSSQRSCWASEMALKAWVGGRATENRDIAMDGQRRSGATGRGKTLLTKLALAHQRLRRSSPSITRPVALHHSPRRPPARRPPAHDIGTEQEAPHLNGSFSSREEIRAAISQQVATRTYIFDAPFQLSSRIDFTRRDQKHKKGK